MKNTSVIGDLKHHPHDFAYISKGFRYVNDKYGESVM